MLSPEPQPLTCSFGCQGCVFNCTLQVPSLRTHKQMLRNQSSWQHKHSSLPPQASVERCSLPVQLHPAALDICLPSARRRPKLHPPGEPQVKKNKSGHSWVLRMWAGFNGIPHFSCPSCLSCQSIGLMLANLPVPPHVQNSFV